MAKVLVMQKVNLPEKNRILLLNFISIWLSMSSFPPRTSPSPPHL